ncbi:MAG: hypothetical protein P8166_04820 [Candidatus Thiodiazotropha sp.]
MNILKSLLLATTALLLVCIGLLIGQHEALSTIDLDTLQKRLTILENNSKQKQPATDIGSLTQRLHELESRVSSVRSTPLTSQGDISDYLITLEDRQRKLEDYVYSSASQFEETIQDDLTGNASTKNPDDNSDQAVTSRDQLNAGIQLLDQATLNGVLDKASFRKLDKIVGSMDQESSKRFWERMIADLQAGKYQFPEEEPTSDYYELPNSEVVGE